MLRYRHLFSIWVQDVFYRIKVEIEPIYKSRLRWKIELPIKNVYFLNKFLLIYLANIDINITE